MNETKIGCFFNQIFRNFLKMSKENSIDFKKLGEKLSDISKTFFDPNYSRYLWIQSNSYYSLRYVVKVLREDAEGENSI